ncbi:carbon-nitrogen hydrolase family protein [Polymorphospora sp. NPDC051019]|uniref:carbon-nitrogen hydrolase family protein n=1 Tax=Polymorphospora sp. NPDC051019 TaxID=3155725 RepID=UPI00343059FE
MRTPLTVAVAQPSCIAHDVGANAAAHAELVRRADARVVVFPEMSLTGYEFDTPAVEPGDPRLAPLVAACAAAGSVALVGAPVAGADGRSHIAVLAVDGAGAVVAYRKQWLGAAETTRFTPGPAPAVVEVDGWRLGLAVCKDTGIPQHAADTAALGIDLYAAGVLDNEPEAGVHEERARRIATGYGVWVAMASFAGSTGEGYDRAAGRSGIWAPDGVRVAAAGPEVGVVARATVDRRNPREKSALDVENRPAAST